MTFPVTVTIPIQWGEMDALGHVNNARYFTWLESARIELLTRIGILADGPRELGPILAAIQCDFVKPAVFPATVIVGVRVSSVGRTSITMAYEIWRENKPDEVHARATSVAVLVDYRTMTKVPVPDAIRARIDALQ